MIADEKRTANSELARYGIAASFTSDGVLELASAGRSCLYSGRNFTPVVGMGAKEGEIDVRYVDRGVAQLRTGGEVFWFTSKDASSRMAISE